MERKILRYSFQNSLSLTKRKKIEDREEEMRQHIRRRDRKWDNDISMKAPISDLVNNEF